jgi:hypothetical protein
LFALLSSTGQFFLKTIKTAWIELVPIGKKCLSHLQQNSRLFDILFENSLIKVAMFGENFFDLLFVQLFIVQADEEFTTDMAITA